MGIKKKTKKLISELSKKYPDILITPDLFFTLNNGVAYYRSKRIDKTKNEIHFNHALSKKVGWDMWREVVIHEYAHFIHRQLDFRGTSHGKEWREIALNLGAIKPRRTIDFSSRSTSFKKNVTKNAYCKCGIVELSQNRYTRLRRGTNVYTCDKCRAEVSLWISTYH